MWRRNLRDFVNFPEKKNSITDDRSVVHLSFNQHADATKAGAQTDEILSRHIASQLHDLFRHIVNPEERMKLVFQIKMKLV